MSEHSQQLKKEILEKNMLLNVFNQNFDLDKTKVQNVETELDGLLYQYYKTLKNKEE